MTATNQQLVKSIWMRIKVDLQERDLDDLMMDLDLPISSLQVLDDVFNLITDEQAGTALAALSMRERKELIDSQGREFDG